MKKPNLRIGKSFITMLVLSTSMMSMTGVTFADQITTNAPPSVTIQGVTWYQVSTAAQLEYIDQNQGKYLNANIALMNDLDLTGFSWTPFGAIAPFKGTFNGQGYGVSGVTVNEPSTDDVGFFGYTLGSNIENLHINDTITGSYYVGGLVGDQSGGTITDSYATGSVKGSNSVGGLVGAQSGGAITDSYATASVNVSGSVAGGLVGFQENGTIADSYATGSVNGSNYVGGLVGSSYVSNLIGSYATGSVEGSTDVGGLVGGFGQGNSISDNYFDTTTTGQSQGIGSGSLPGVFGEVDTAMKTEATFSSWDFSKTWGISSAIHQGYPYLRNTISSGNSGGLVGQMPEVPLAGVLPLLGLAGVGAFWLRRRQSVK